MKTGSYYDSAQVRGGMWGKALQAQGIPALVSGLPAHIPLGSGPPGYIPRVSEGKITPEKLRTLLVESNRG